VLGNGWEKAVVVIVSEKMDGGRRGEERVVMGNLEEKNEPM